MMVDPLPWQTLETKSVYRNRWIGVSVDKVALPDGRSYEYTRLEPAGIGVAVIGFNERGEVLLEREYRHGVGQTIWQLPGGLAAVGEDYQAAGLRELLEETGFAPREVNAATVRYLGMVWDNPGFGIAQSQLYAAWGLV
jgi:ADP-ribose pyrophosphatase